MRKWILRLMAILICLMSVIVLLPAPVCAAEGDSTYVVERDGISFTVDPENKTITVGGDVYHYRVNTSGDEETTTITYPNGATYYWTQKEYYGFGGGSEHYDPDIYLDGEILVDIVDQIRPAKGNGLGGIKINVMNVLMGVVVIVMGIFTAANPYDAWYWSIGWRFKDAEPSDMALEMARFGGILEIIGGIILMFV